MAKLTLSIDASVISKAKIYARKKDTSVSGIVQDYLERLSAGQQVSAQTPVLQSLRGILKNTDSRDYKRYLDQKYS